MNEFHARYLLTDFLADLGLRDDAGGATGRSPASTAATSFLNSAVAKAISLAVSVADAQTRIDGCT